MWSSNLFNNGSPSVINRLCKHPHIFLLNTVIIFSLHIQVSRDWLKHGEEDFSRLIDIPDIWLSRWEIKAVCNVARAAFSSPSQRPRCPEAWGIGMALFTVFLPKAARSLGLIRAACLTDCRLEFPLPGNAGFHYCSPWQRFSWALQLGCLSCFP